MTLFHAQENFLRREMDIGRGGTSVAPFPIELEPPFRLFKHPSGGRSEQQRGFPRPKQAAPPGGLCFIRVRFSLKRFLAGKRVFEIADELGISREQCSRRYRKEAFALAGAQFMRIISAENR